MALTRVQFLIEGIKKQQPRLYDALKGIIFEIEGIQANIGKLVFNNNQTLGGRTDTSFANVTKELNRQQKTVTENAVKGLGGGGGGNMLKRLSVRI